MCFYFSIFVIVSYVLIIFFFFFKQKTAYEMRISDWSSDVCSSDLRRQQQPLSPALMFSARKRLLLTPIASSFSIPSCSTPIPRTCGEIGRASCRERVCQYV